MSAPKVFISYSHDSEDHKDWVRKFASDLRGNGIDADLDQWQPMGSDLASFMHSGIARSDRVLLICTDSYVQKAEAGTGGVGYEKLILTGEMVQSVDTIKFIPVCRLSDKVHRIPKFLGAKFHVDFDRDDEYVAKLEELCRELLGQPKNAKPPLGHNPFSGVPPENVILAPKFSAAGVAEGGQRLLDSDWFSEQEKAASKTADKMKVVGRMEFRFGLIEPIRKSQIELLNSLRKSTVETFGWPIPILLESRDEFKPRPFGDGIRAEIAIENDGNFGRTSFDYWAANNNGNFYLLQSLFEDSRRENEIFFNTRIVRVTEALMFLGAYYSNLTVGDETQLVARVGHKGLKGRSLTSSNRDRFIFPKVTAEDACYSEINCRLSDVKSDLAGQARRILEPLFLLFDFQEFAPEIYQDIVGKFKEGKVT